MFVWHDANYKLHISIWVVDLSEMIRLEPWTACMHVLLVAKTYMSSRQCHCRELPDGKPGGCFVILHVNAYAPKEIEGLIEDVVDERKAKSMG